MTRLQLLQKVARAMHDKKEQLKEKEQLDDAVLAAMQSDRCVDTERTQAAVYVTSALPSRVMFCE